LIFIDTTILVSAADESDTLHTDGAAVLKALHDGKIATALTTDFVIDEVLTLLRRRHAKSATTSRIAENVLSSTLIRIAYVDETLFKESLPNFRKYEQLSFTDAVSLTVMKKYRIREIFSHDTDFDLRGLVRKERP
jgi:uncharacterized protein